MLKRILDIAPPILAVMAIIGGAFFVVWLMFTRVLLPPDTLVMAAGREGSGYHTFAKRYQDILALDNIELQILETAGSVENLRLLEDGTADVAFVQGGVSVPKDAGLESLAAVFLEPLLIIHRKGVGGPGDPTQWGNLRVAGGEAESGTRAAVNAIVTHLGLTIAPARLLQIGGADAVAALRAGEVDVAIFVAPIDAPYLLDLLPDPEFAIRPVRDAEALARMVEFVRFVDVPPSGFDYARHLPAQRIELLAMVATLVGDRTLHPALVNRLVRAAQKIHGGPSILTPEPEFPSEKGTQLPLDPQAAAVLRSDGPNPLENLLPYWVAAQITRVTVVLLPLVILLLPILRATPGLVAWRLRARVYRNYNRLVRIEQEAADRPPTDARREELLRKLQKIDDSITELSLPPRYREYAYSLRMHIDLVRRRLS